MLRDQPPDPGSVGEALRCRCPAVGGKRALPTELRRAARPPGARPGGSEGPVLSAPGRGGQSRGLPACCWRCRGEATGSRSRTAGSGPCLAPQPQRRRAGRPAPGLDPHSVPVPRRQRAGPVRGARARAAQPAPPGPETSAQGPYRVAEQRARCQAPRPPAPQSPPGAARSPVPEEPQPREAPLAVAPRRPVRLGAGVVLGAAGRGGGRLGAAAPGLGAAVPRLHRP